VVLFGIVHFVASPFWSRPFLRKFYKNNFFLLLFSIFLIYKKKFFRLSFSVLFSKTVEDFLFIFNKYLSTPHKKIQVQTHATVFYSVIPVTDKINS